MFYLDNMDFGELNIDNKFMPRCKYYTWVMVKKLVAASKIDSAGQTSVRFGHAKVQF